MLVSPTLNRIESKVLDRPLLWYVHRLVKKYSRGENLMVVISPCCKKFLSETIGAGVLPNGVNPKDQYTKQVDIFAFGLCVLELATKKKLDSSNCAIWPELLQSVQDEDARAFISRCASLPLRSSPGFHSQFFLGF